MYDTSPIDYSELPQHMQLGFQYYIEHHIAPGGFGTAMLAHDWDGARRRADCVNIHNIERIANWIAKFIPENAQGSYQHVDNWVNQRFTNQESQR